MAAGMEREGTVSDGRVCEDASAGIYLRFMTRDDTGLIVRWRNSEPVRKNFIYQALLDRKSVV